MRGGDRLHGLGLQARRRCAALRDRRLTWPRSTSTFGKVLESLRDLAITETTAVSERDKASQRSLVPSAKESKGENRVGLEETMRIN